MTQPQPLRRYLDNAATSWPKPEPVLEAWEHAARSIGATAGRAAYREAVAADAIRRRARERAASLLGGVDPARVALPGGATLALNMAIHGIVQPGDHVIATAADHNATLRPLHWLERRGVIAVTIVPCDASGRVDPAAVAAAWRPATRLVACSHASNVTGAVQDAAALAAIAHARDGLLLLDAAQTLGIVTFPADCHGADIVVAPAHKWVHGMSGAALLWARPILEIDPPLQGGTGTASESLDMPAGFVERLEAGTPDVPALAALASAVDWLEERSIAALAAQCRELATDCADGLHAIAGVRVIAAPEGGAPIVSFTVDGYDPAEMAVILEQAAGIQARSGFHCAACVHEFLGTSDGGTVRLGFGPHNTADDVDAVVQTVSTLTRG